MAGETGSARDEAERLVATVLAMAGQAARGDGDSLAGTGARLVEGLGTLGDTVAGMVGRLTTPPAETRPADARPADARPADARPADGPHADGRPADGRPEDGKPAHGDTHTGVGTPGQASRHEDVTGTPAGSGPAGGGSGPASGWSGPASAAEAWSWAGERLWAAGARTAWAAATQGRGTHGGRWATGSPECCVCPVCRSIAAMRNPTPQTAERLATGAGDLATGVASLMRAFSAMSGSRPKPARRPAPPPADPDVAWSAATRTGDGPDREPDLAPGADESPWAAATHAAAREQAEEARKRAAAATRERAEAARRRAEEARLRVEEARAAAEAARRVAAERAASPDPAPGNAWTAGPRTGQDVWAAATADRGDVGVPDAPGVDHDLAGDEA